MLVIEGTLSVYWAIERRPDHQSSFSHSFLCTLQLWCRYMKTGVIPSGKLLNIKCVISSLVREPEKLVCVASGWAGHSPALPGREWKGYGQGKPLARELWWGWEVLRFRRATDCNMGVDFCVGAPGGVCGGSLLSPDWNSLGFCVAGRRRPSSCQAIQRHAALLPGREDYLQG